MAKKPKPHPALGTRLVPLDFRADVEPIAQRGKKRFLTRVPEVFADVRHNLKAHKGVYRLQSKAGAGFSLDSVLFNKSKWQSLFLDDTKSIMGDALTQTGDMAMSAIDRSLGGSFDMAQTRVLAWLEAAEKRAAWSITDTLYDGIKAELKDGIDLGESIDDLASRLDDMLDDTDWDGHGEMIARTETLKATNYACKEAMRQSGVCTGATWLCTEDDRTCEACDAMDGAEIDLDENFYDLGDEDTFGEGDNAVDMNFDYENIEAPPLHPDCRCCLTAVVDMSLLATSDDEETNGIFDLVTKYSDDQPRDEDGRWGSGGGSSGEGGRDFGEMSWTTNAAEFDEGEKEAVKWGTENLSPEVNQTDKEREAIELYQSSGYRTINGCLRGEEKADSETRGTIKKMDSLLEKSQTKEDVTAYRGVDEKTFEKLSGEGMKSFQDKGFVSTSLNSGFAKTYAEENGGTIKIEVPKGTNAYFLNNRYLSTMKHEHELLLSRGKTFEIKSVDSKTRTITVRIKE
jgi:hypothetical protein